MLVPSKRFAPPIVLASVAAALFFFFAAPAFVAAPAQVEPDSPAAVLTSCRGPVTVQRADGRSEAGAFGTALREGDEVRTGAKAEAEIMFETGNWVQVGPNSSMRIKGHPAARAGNGSDDGNGKQGKLDVVQSFIKLKNAEGTSSLTGLRSGEKASALAAISPCQTKVRDAHPTFRWEIDDPSKVLRLTIYHESGVHWQTVVSAATSLQYPADAPALAPAVSYSWTLETADPLVFPPVRTQASFFELLPAEDSQRLESALASIDAKKPGPLTYHLIRASLYFDRGLVDDAIAETETALASDPENAALHAILGRLYAETGRTKDAIAELNRGAAQQ